MKPLDFLIIGAQKCATTTLFEHLRHHPQITMPLEKEVPFFTGSDCSASAWEAFSEQQFGAGTGAALRGKASPQYMCDPQVPARIHALMPAVKLIAILRDPLERTGSHFQMGLRRETEQRSFAEAIRPLLAEGASKDRCRLPVPDHAQGYQSEQDFYVSWSEYGRSLSGFNQYFGPDQLLVLYTEDLHARPEETLDKLLEFIGLEAGFRPPALGQVMHRGGSKKRIPQSVRQWFRDIGLLYWMWQRLPEAQRGRLRFKYEQWNISRQGGDLDLPEDLQQQLLDHYATDLRALMQLPVSEPPWLQRYRTFGQAELA